MSNRNMEKLITLMVNEDSNPEVINSLFSACVFERIKEKLKERDEFLYSAIKSMEIIAEADVEEPEEEPEEESEEESETDDDESEEESTSASFPACDSFDVETAIVTSVITLNVDVEGLSDEDKTFIEDFINGDITEEDKQTLLASIYGDGEWVGEIPEESFEPIEDKEVFEEAEAFNTPTEDLCLVLVRDEDEGSIKVFASKPETSEE